MLNRREFLQGACIGIAAMTVPSWALRAAADTKTDDLLNYDATGLAKLVRTKQVSPKELVEATIRRIEALDGKINAVVTRTFEQALKRADTIKPLGPFAGVPFSLKDNIDLLGVRTTQGSSFYKNHLAVASAPLVLAYEAAGFNIVGKTNMPELGLISTTESTLLGACANPWGLSYSTGGSSGGSAAAVAAGYMPVAHATDGGGSIRVPSSCCGVFGLKPSRRRMLWGASDQTEFMADHCTSRSVRDSALLFAITQDRSPDAPFKPLEFVSGPGKRRLKIGLGLRNYFGSMPHHDVRKAIEATAKLCEGLGHTVLELENPVNGSEFHENFYAIFSARFSRLIDHITTSTGKPASEFLERLTIDFEAEGHSLGSDAVEKAQQYMKSLEGKVAQWMQSVDLLLTPVLRDPPPQLGYLFDPTQEYEEMADRLFDYTAYTPMQNALGMPAMSVPLGMSSKGLPIGSHFIARAGEEKTLFELAYELEQAQPWADKWAPNSAKA